MDSETLTTGRVVQTSWQRQRTNTTGTIQREFHELLYRKCKNQRLLKNDK